jgi:hypothetical protein
VADRLSEHRHLDHADLQITLCQARIEHQRAVMARLIAAGEDTRVSAIVLNTLERMLSEFVRHREAIVRTLDAHNKARRNSNNYVDGD